ncbi:MAG TPA: hypothetical protein VJN96_03570, partial [Vicinamibacterales bacterium]|nr:hypothetical protein [Vicinamibacterales bacterium]
MRLAASLPVQPRWFFVAVLLAVFGALPAVRAQTPAGTYGVELRGAGDGSRVEARVGPDTAKPETRRTAIVVPKSPQPFTVKWSAREVSVTIGGQSIRYAATWRIGNAVRIAARGNVRASIGVVGGRRVDKMVFDDLVVAGANLSKSWTLEGAIDWPDEPTPADVLTVTSTTQDQATPGTDPKDRKTFTGGVADSSILVSPVAGAPLTAPRVASRFGARASLSGVERTWNGGDGLWSNPNNWDPRGVPQNGDIATFSPGSGNSFRTTNDLTPSPALGGLNVRNGNLQIQGNGVTLLPGSQSELERDTSVDLLNGGGTIEIANNRVFTVGRQGQPTPVATSLFSGTITGDKGTLVKDGPGAITFTGDASGIQETDIKQGDFFLNGGSLSDVVATGPNQTLSMANAHVGSLNVRNDGEMGDARSRVATTGDVQMEGMSYVQTIAGPDDFQKLITTGTVRLSHNGRSRLTVQLTGGYVPNLGAQFIMIDNDGTDPVDGTFDGLPEGAFINLGGVVFRLSYAAGTGNDIGLTVVQSGARPDLTIAKTKSGSFNAGETGTFTLTVTNVGTAPTARTATVTDTLPAGFAPQTASGPGWGCNISSQQVSCSRGDALAAGASYPDIAIGVLVAQNAPDATNTASVRVDGDQNTANDTASVSVIVGRVIDLAILKKHLTAFKQGGTGTYVIGVSNPGTTASSGLVTVTDALPSGLTPTSAAGPGWTCNVSAPTVTCTRSNSLAPGASFDPIQIGVSIASNAPASVANIATLSGGGDTTPANNTSTDVTPIAQVTPDLTIAKAQVESQFVPGQTGHFTIKVSNGGTGSTNGTVTVSDVLAASLAQPVAIGSGWSCGTSVQTITCTRPDALAAGGDYPPITITVQVAASPGQPSNTATVSGGGDVNQNNNSITIPVNISNIGPADQPDLFVTKDQTGVVAQGGTISFAITVGNSATAGLWSGTVTLTDSLPAGLTQPIGSGQGWSCNNGQAVTCTRSGDLAAGTSYPMLTIAANVSPTATSDTNRVTITAPNDSNLANNIAEKSYTVLARSANLTIAKSNTGPFTPGQSASFTITVTNNGPVPTTGTVNVDDVVPPGLTPTSVTASGWTCPVAQHVTCTRGDPLAAGASYAPITILASVALGAQSGENSAVVSGGGDTTPDDNTAISAFVVTGSPNLSLTKTHTGNFTVGQQGAQYQIVARNAGTAQTIGPVTVDDTIPLGLTPTGASGAGWACTIAAQLVECTRGDNLAAGQSWPTITIVVNVGTTVGTLNNTATVSGGGDANPNDNSVVDSTIISGQPQLTIVKTHADPVIQGAPDLPFTIVVSNNGTAQTAGTVTVTDPLPGGLTPTSASGPGWACSIAGATVTCTRSDALAAAADYPALQIRASVAPTATTVTNIAAVAGGGDTTPADNTFSDPVPISPAGQPNLAITKRHDGNFFQGQQNATYRLRIANVGVAPTSGTVTVSDDVPVGLTPATASGAGWSCSISSQHVQCSRGDSLGPGTVYPEIDLLCQVANNATDIVNVATVTGGGDQTPNDNSGSDTTHIAGRSPNLSVTKSHADPFLVGQQDASYQIAVANVGSAPTNGPVVVTDGIPAGLTPAAASGAGWTCTIAGQTVTCQRSDSLAAGAAYPAITLRVSVLAGASNLSNVVTVSGGGDTTPDNNTAVDATSINVSPDATISLGPTSPLVVADTAEYQSVVSNLGPGWIGGQTTVVATFPTDLIPVFGHGDGWQCQTSGQQVSCQRVSSLGPNTAFAPLRFRVMVRLGPSAVTVAARVNNSADNNTANNVAVSDTQTVLPTTGLTIDQKTTTPSVAVGGTAAYQVTVVNTGQARLEHVVLQDLLPRGFVFAAATHTAASSQRTVLNQAVTVTNGLVSWPLGTLNAGEAVTLNYQAIVGADARSGLQETRASVSADDLRGDTVQAGPAIVTVDVTTEVFTMLQAIVGRVFEDVDGNGMFGGGDRPIANARVITSTGQAALTDEAGLYNIPSIGSGTVAVSLDRDTIPSGLTVIDGPGGRSWTRLLRTPIGGGSLLTQNFALERAAGATATAAAPVTPPDAADVNRVP